MKDPKAPKSLAEQIADLEDPAPKDIDPEGFGGAFDHPVPSDSDVESVVDEDDGREHYETVGKSKLREPAQVVLGKAYVGAQVSRHLLENGDDESGGNSSDDPFAREVSGFQSDEDEEDDGEGFADPEKVDLKADAIGFDDEEIDSDEAFGEGDEDAFKSYRFRASRTTNGHAQDNDMDAAVGENGVLTDEDAEDGEEEGTDVSEEDDGNSGESREDMDGLENEFDGLDGVSDEEDEDEDEDEEDEGDSEDEVSNAGKPAARRGKEPDRAALRAMMAGEQKSLVSTLSEAAKSDAAKGSAVKHQRETFDSLLNTRIRLQKALIATNSLPSPVPHTPEDSHDSLIASAESAALELFNSLSSLRASLPSTTTSKPSKKRPFAATLSTSTTEMHSYLQGADASSVPSRRSTLTKWAQKTHLATSVPSQSKFSAPSTHSITTLLDTQLSGSNLDRLIARTKVPRNCAPLQAAATSKATSEHDIYDDADYYSLLLRDLVDSKMAVASTSATGAAAATRALNTGNIAALRSETKMHRSGLDVKASKGRKMRYTVHEKLQNFMAPDDRGRWEERQADELFAGLLGRKVKGGLGEEEDEEEETTDADVAGLRLFGGEV